MLVAAFSLLQMLFLATFFPTWEGGVGAYDFIGVSLALGQAGQGGSLQGWRYNYPYHILLTVLQHWEHLCLHNLRDVDLGGRGELGFSCLLL